MSLQNVRSRKRRYPLSYILQTPPRWCFRALLIVLRLLTMFSNRRIKRSLWVGRPIITLAINARAEALLGIKADSLVYETYFITNAFTYNLQRWVRRGPKWWRRLFPYFVLLWACLRYQRFHFYYDHGLLPPTTLFHFNKRELAIYKYLGKEIFFYAYGADVRTRTRTEALGSTNCCSDCAIPGSCCVCSEKTGAKNYRRIKKAATGVFSMGDMVEYTPGSRNDLYYWPIDLQEDQGRKYAPRYPDPASTAPIRIVHSPNHRSFKGTNYLLHAVARLQEKGIPLELKLVERVPNDQALALYRTADIIFDQCLIGFHGYFALEAMALGKPVMVFIRHPDRYLLHPDECPLINTPASRVEQVLAQLVSDRQKLHDLGIQGRHYIENHYTLAAVAHRLAQVYIDLGLTAPRRGPSRLTGAVVPSSGVV